jgi:hypothetical protein
VSRTGARLYEPPITNTTFSIGGISVGDSAGDRLIESQYVSLDETLTAVAYLDFADLEPPDGQVRLEGRDARLPERVLFEYFHECGL